MPSVQPSQGTPSRRPSSVRPTIWWPGIERELRLRQLAVDDVEVGAADAAGRHAQQDLARPRLRRRNLLEPQRLAGRVKHHRAHATSISCGRVLDLIPRRGPGDASGREPAPASGDRSGRVSVRSGTCPGRAAGLARETVRSRRGDDPAVRLVHRSRDPAAGAGADSARVAVRRPHGTAAQPGYFAAHRPHARRRHARPRRRAARLRQRLPPPRPMSRRRRAEPRDAPVPVPRVDVRPRRPPPRGAAQRGGAELPAGRARPRARRGRHVGPVRVRQRQHRSENRSPRRSARSRRRSRSLGSTSTRSSTTPAGRPRSRRTGRSSARTSSSATTARSRTPASARSIDVSPDAYVLSTDGRLSTQHGPLRTATPERRAAARAVPLPLAEPRDQHLRRPAEHLDRPDRPARRPTGRIASSTTSSARTSSRPGSTTSSPSTTRSGGRTARSSRACSAASPRARSTTAC